MLAGTATAVSAQTKDKYYSESWKDNIYISVGGGVQATTNPDTKFGKSITPLVNLSIGKLINPIWDSVAKYTDGARRWKQIIRLRV